MGTSPTGSRRTGLERLRSSDSHHPTIPFHQRPMRKQCGLSFGDFRQPLSGSAIVSPELFVFTHSPPCQAPVDVTKSRIHG